jgi:hypothetical protein
MSEILRLTVNYGYLEAIEDLYLLECYIQTLPETETKNKAALRLLRRAKTQFENFLEGVQWETSRKPTRRNPLLPGRNNVSRNDGNLQGMNGESQVVVAGE